MHCSGIKDILIPCYRAIFKHRKNQDGFSSLFEVSFLVFYNAIQLWYGPEKIRTSDTSFRKRVLSPLSYGTNSTIYFRTFWAVCPALVRDLENFH